MGTNTGYYQDIDSGKILKRDLGKKNFEEVKGQIEVVGGGRSNKGDGTSGLPPRASSQVLSKVRNAQYEAEQKRLAEEEARKKLEASKIKPKPEEQKAKQRLDELQKKAELYSQRGKIESYKSTNPKTGEKYDIKVSRANTGINKNYVFQRKNIETGETEVFENEGGKRRSGVRYTETKVNQNNEVLEKAKPSEKLYFDKNEPTYSKRDEILKGMTKGVFNVAQGFREGILEGFSSRIDPKTLKPVGFDRLTRETSLQRNVRFLPNTKESIISEAAVTYSPLAVGGLTLGSRFIKSINNGKLLIQNKRAYLGSLESVSKSEYVYYKGKYIKKKDLAKELSGAIKESSVKETKDFIKTQIKNINKLNIPKSEKLKKIEDLRKFVSTARGETIIVNSVKPTNIKPQSVRVGNVQSNSIYAGKGAYEQSGFTSSRISQVQNTNSNRLSPSIEETSTKQSLEIKNIQMIKPKLSSLSKSNNKQVSLLDNSQKQKLDQQLKQDNFQRTNQKSVQDSRNILRSQNSLLNRLVQRTNFIKQKTREQTKTGFKIPFKLPETPKSKKGFLSNIKDSGNYEVFGRRFGKDILLGSVKDEKKAEKVLDTFLKSTLGRSGFIAQNGSKIDLSLFRDKTYRPSKKDSKRIVQRKEFSLGSFGEVKEILGAKNKAKKRNLFFN